MKRTKTIKGILFILSYLIFVNAKAHERYFKIATTAMADTGKLARTNQISDSLILDFTFKDTLDRPIRISDFRGKYVFVDLWYSGCGFCIYANRGLRKVHEKLKGKNIIFLSISVDTNRKKWIESITKDAKPSKIDPWGGEYYPAPGTIVLYTGGSGYNNDFVKKYDPKNEYPELLLISPSGKLITDHAPRPDYSGEDRPEKLIDFLSGYLRQ
jgi:thiol-disulfide isomerase/thioredoxin